MRLPGPASVCLAVLIVFFRVLVIGVRTVDHSLLNEICFGYSVVYRDTSLIRGILPLGRYSRPMHRILWCS